MTDLASGPSGGVLGRAGVSVDRDLFEQDPGMAKKIFTIGRQRRAGHDRTRWATVNWEDYRARIGVGGKAGPWYVTMVESMPDGPTAWMCESEDLPFEAGWHTALMHADRGLIMSDVPAEIAGCLPFLDAAEEIHSANLLIAGLGLGIVPARLLSHGQVNRIDVVEIDPDVIQLVTEDASGDGAPNAWATDPRLHIWNADACTWRRPRATTSCVLHDGGVCGPPGLWDAAWFDIWDTVSAGNLPSMHRLTRKYARQAVRSWCWERPECEAMRGRGQVHPRPDFMCGASFPGDSDTRE